MPVASRRQQVCQSFQPLFINIIKPILNLTININNRHNLSLKHNRDNNLTHSIAIARYVTRKLFHIRYQLRLLGGCSSTTDSPPEGNGLAGYFALEGAENELRF
jgi:hypothetical protein